MGDIEARMIEDVERVEAELKLHPLQRSGRRLRCSQAPLRTLKEAVQQRREKTA